MSRLIELVENRTKAWEAAKAFLESKRDEDGIVAAENIAVFNKMEADVAAIDCQIELLERIQATDAKYTASLGRSPVLEQHSKRLLANGKPRRSRKYAAAVKAI